MAGMLEQYRFESDFKLQRNNTRGLVLHGANEDPAD
jgi:hypothetical protein